MIGKYMKILIISMILILLPGCADNKENEALMADSIILEETQIAIESGQQGSNISESEEVEIVVEGNKGTITIGTIGTPYDELLTQAKIILAKEGWDVQIKTYTDHKLMNQDVLAGTIDAHLFSHQTYLDSYNDVNGTTLMAVAPICYEKYGIYSLLNDDLTKITTGVAVGIPQEDTQKARTLLFLEDLGYITLKEGVGLTAILEDIVENKYNLQFVEYTEETAKKVLQDTDYCIMGADQAILCDLEPHKDVLKEETPQMNSANSMAALLVTTAENVENEKLLILKEALLSETMQKYAEDTYKGALGLF